MTIKSACIVLPTYNESANIGSLIDKIMKINKNLNSWNLSILVVDDNSPDATADIVRKYQKKYKNIYLSCGEKKGLGAAYIRGFKYSLSHIHPDFIFEMDADGQHNPSYIPHFLSQIELGYEFIIGSRYIPGGDYPDWTYKRKLYSYGANVIARIIAGIYKVNDCTSGFRCISANFLRQIPYKEIRANGYAFQMELLHRAVYQKVKILQVPIKFPNRTKGVSKLNRSDVYEFFFNALILRFRKYSFTKKKKAQKKSFPQRLYRNLARITASFM